MLEVASPDAGRPVAVHPTLFYDAKTVILVDTGFPGQLPMLKAAVEQVMPFGRIAKIVITHQDIDHIGNLPGILSGAKGKVEVLSGAEDKPYIEGEKKLLKGDPKQREKMLALMPPERREAFVRLLANPPTAKVDRTLANGEELPFCGGITVIATPGHTPGHICLYHKVSKTLVAGDALRVVEGRLAGPAPQNAFDLEQANRSVKKLAQYDIANIICYHGGLFRGDVKSALELL